MGEWEEEEEEEDGVLLILLPANPGVLIQALGFIYDTVLS